MRRNGCQRRRLSANKTIRPGTIGKDSCHTSFAPTASTVRSNAVGRADSKGCGMGQVQRPDSVQLDRHADVGTGYGLGVSPEHPT